MFKNVNKRFLEIVTLSCLFCTTAVQAAPSFNPPEELAMRSVFRILRQLDNVLPGQEAPIINRLATGKMRLETKENPFWILHAEAGSILYYQGNAAFAGQSATRLVDDQGNRFGAKALESALQSKNRWQTVTLNKYTYKVFCGSSFPYVVCTLLTKSAKPAASPVGLAPAATGVKP